MQIHLIDQVYQVGVVWQGRGCFVRLCTFPFSLLDGGWVGAGRGKIKKTQSPVRFRLAAAGAKLGKNKICCQNPT